MTVQYNNDWARVVVMVNTTTGQVDYVSGDRFNLTLPCVEHGFNVLQQCLVAECDRSFMLQSIDDILNDQLQLTDILYKIVHWNNIIHGTIGYPKQLSQVIKQLTGMFDDNCLNHEWNMFRQLHGSNDLVNKMLNKIQTQLKQEQSQ